MESVLNWLWQGSAVALAAAIMLRFLESARARVRYRALWIVLLTVLVLPMVASLWTVFPGGYDAAAPAAPAAPVMIIPSGWWTSTNVMLVLWAAWSAVHAGRVARAAYALRQAKKRCLPVRREMAARLPCWSRVRTTGRLAHLALSASVKSAAVLGGRRPLIALAPALVDQLTDEELDRVVIHEWAHVQRHDDVAHLLQLLVVMVAGWHPAVWWCNRQLNVEREVACDEMAVGLTGSARQYAACLTRVASVRPVAAGPLPAAVALSTSGLRRRIVRILSLDRRAGRPRTISAIAAAMVLGFTAVAAGSYRAVVARPLPAEDNSLTTPAADEASSSVRLASAVASPAPTRQPVESAPVAERPRRSGVQSPADQSSAPVDDPSPTAPLDTPSHEPQSAPLASRAAAAASVIDVPPGLARPGGTPASSIDASVSITAPPASPWGAAADAGVAVGRGTQDAAVATAGFFSRLGRRIGGSF